MQKHNTFCGRKYPKCFPGIWVWIFSSDLDHSCSSVFLCYWWRKSNGNANEKIKSQVKDQTIADWGQTALYIQKEFNLSCRNGKEGFRVLDFSPTLRLSKLKKKLKFFSWKIMQGNSTISAERRAAATYVDSRFHLDGHVLRSPAPGIELSSIPAFLVCLREHNLWILYCHMGYWASEVWVYVSVSVRIISRNTEINYLVMPSDNSWGSSKNEAVEPN